jgi:excisionase family DNA binding protein
MGRMSTQSSPRLLRRSEVAELLGVSNRQLDRLVRAGLIPVIRFDRRPRFRAEDVDAFVTARRVTPREAA